MKNVEISLYLLYDSAYLAGSWFGQYNQDHRRRRDYTYSIQLSVRKGLLKEQILTLLPELIGSGKEY